MKKTVSILLSLVFVLSMLLAVPAGAATKLNNSIPKTIKMGNITYTGSYNSKNKTLTYKSNTNDEDSPVAVYEFLILAMTINTTDTKINQDFCDLVDDEIDLLSLAFNDMVRTGKIKKIIINSGKNLYGNKIGFEFQFKTKNNHVTSMDFVVYEAGGESFSYSYDSNGNIKKITDTISEDTWQIYTSNGQISSISRSAYYNSRNHQFNYVPEYNDKGYIKSNNTMSGAIYLDGNCNKDGNLEWASKEVKYDNGKTVASPKVTFTYMKI